MSKVFLLTVLINLVGLSISQECNLRVVEWLPHQHSCQRFILCFHGNPLEFSCAPGLHFSPTELKCMLPSLAKCHIDFMCPEIDDENNPIFLPDRVDCRNYFVCFKGNPLLRRCAENLWFDIENRWCTFEDVVTCDERTVNNPRNPETTTTAVTSSTETPVTTGCFQASHLFNPVDGTYMKSFCILNTLFNYEQAEMSCRDRNMNLFIINDSAVQSEFFFATTNALIQHPRGFLWINGRTESVLEWFTFSPDRAPLYSGIDWVETDEINGRSSGNCLRYSQQHGPYKAMGETCESASWISCEYFSPPVFNTEICKNKNQLIDNSGNFLKTACIVDQSVLYTEAEQICAQSGMQLFVINNSTVQTAFENSVTESLIMTDGSMWINGRRENEEWFVHDPVRSLIFDGIDWVQTINVNGRTSGNCLEFTSQFGSPMRSMGADCRNRNWFACEF